VAAPARLSIAALSEDCSAPREWNVALEENVITRNGRSPATA
jgi:hypothetical protein